MGRSNAKAQRDLGPSRLRLPGRLPADRRQLAEGYSHRCKASHSKALADLDAYVTA